MKMDVWMALEPAVILGLLGAEILENDMNLFFIAVGVSMRLFRTVDSERNVMGAD
jgi:hypothetical protein